MRVSTDRTLNENRRIAHRRIHRHLDEIFWDYEVEPEVIEEIAYRMTYGSAGRCLGEKGRQVIRISVATSSANDNTTP